MSSLSSKYSISSFLLLKLLLLLLLLFFISFIFSSFSLPLYENAILNNVNVTIIDINTFGSVSVFFHIPSLGIILTILAFDMILRTGWLFYLVIGIGIITIVYAIVSSIMIEKRRK